ncbi:MAG: SIR2 family protein [Lautropia sp.]|nr:SIR2 family protein [Lautropia sp.]
MTTPPGAGINGGNQTANQPTQTNQNANRTTINRNSQQKQIRRIFICRIWILSPVPQNGRLERSSQKVCAQIKPFEFYNSQANNYLPLTAKYISEDFFSLWWESDEYKESREKFSNSCENKTYPLRLEISKYLESSTSNTKPPELTEEINLLSELNIDGIITTNWDRLLEDLFGDYHVYIGQEELLFSQTQGIGEIYKIHGCTSQPESMILTSDDYDDFESKNPYLAAKLMTIFIEHPIIFIGYSLQDKNIQNILLSISKCVGQKQIENLRRNLIFLQRCNKINTTEGITESSITIDEKSIPITLITTNSFSPAYKALGSMRRQIPTRILRQCKEQLYELAKSRTPEKQILIIDPEEIDEKKDIEFVIGIGVATTHNDQYVAKTGYTSISIKEIIEDVINDDKNYDASEITKNVIPQIGKSAKYIPLFKYLDKQNIKKQKRIQAMRPKSRQMDKHIARKIQAKKLCQPVLKRQI